MRDAKVGRTAFKSPKGSILGWVTIHGKRIVFFVVVEKKPVSQNVDHSGGNDML